MSGLVVRTEPLGGSGLARAALEGALPEGWYVRCPAGADEWRRHLEVVRGGAADWAERLAPALEAEGAAAARLARSAGGRGVVVTTGQQPGLFGGPIYTWSKALSALALADELERATGVPVAPVFWAATDDSDFAEAAFTWVSGPDGAERLTLDATGPAGVPMADLPLGDVSAQLEALARAAGSAAHPDALRAAREAYGPDATVGSAYLRLLRLVLQPLGIAVLDASHPVLVDAMRPVLRLALHKAPEVAHAVEERTRELDEEGFAAQVAPVAGLTLVSVVEDGVRTRVPLDRAAQVADRRDARLGTTVLVRPVVERAILPTAGYVAGPGEIAYFAQSTAVADALGAARPLVVPRWSGTVLEPRVRELLAEYGLPVESLADPHAPERELSTSLLPPAVTTALRTLRAAVQDGTAALSAAPDPLVPEAVPAGFARDVSHRVDRLERRYRAAVARREAAMFRDLARLRGALHPGGARQERALNFLPLLARYGPALVEAMLEEARAHARSLVGAAARPDAAAARVAG